MEVWVVFESHSWCDADWHTEWNIYGIYNSEEKAKETVASLQKEQEDYFNSLSDWEKENEYDDIGYRVEKHSIQ